MVLFDREKYYKTIGTGMVQFGVKMNFLQIKQVLTFIYALKLISDINFSDFQYYLDWASNFIKRRGFWVKLLRLREQCKGWRVHYSKPQGPLC